MAKQRRHPSSLYDAGGALKLVNEYYHNDLQDVLDLIENRARHGGQTTYTDLLPGNIVRQLKERGFKVELDEESSNGGHRIEW